MTLKTARVHDAMLAQFSAAEDLVSRLFAEKLEAPQRGTIEIFGERYILMRAASLSVEFFALVEQLYGDGRRAEADAFSQSLLFDLAHAIGKADATSFHARTGVTDPVSRVAAGPVHFSHSGWAFVDILTDSLPPIDEDFSLLFDHPYSFESDAWARAGQSRDFPVCVMNAGYSSGWTEASLGLSLVAAEVLCRSKGDDVCRFVMAPPSRIEARVAEFCAATQTPSAARRPPPEFFARRRIEDELVKSRADLERRVAERTAELTLANARLTHEMRERERAERKLVQTHRLEAIGRLAGGIAHDFNNMMAVILGNGGLVARRLHPGDPLHPFVQQILEAGERASKLTQQLLTFSRAQVLPREHLLFNDVVRGVAHMLDRVIGETVSIAWNLGDDAGAVLADRGQVEQVVMNLIMNARDAMPDGGRITVTTGAVVIDSEQAARIANAPRGKYIQFDVQDEGTGMDEETQSHIFEPFFTTKEVGRGTGLGLATVYGIVKQLGGAISVSSTPGLGSLFRILLPREATNPVSRRPAASHSSYARGESVLVVDDQEPLRRVIRRVLEEFGYKVFDAKDAAGAMEVAKGRDGKIDLLLTDVLMPHVTGPELAEAFREAWPDAKVLYMSGFADEATLGRAKGRALVPLIAKPFTPEILANRVREVLDARPALEPPPAPIY